VKRPIHSISALLGCGLAASGFVCRPAAAQIPTRRAEGTAPATKPAETPKPVAQEDTFPALQRGLADAITQGDLARAVAIAERQHKLYPNEMKATADLAGVYLARGDEDRAEPLLRAAIGQQNKLYTSGSTTVLGTIYANLGQIALDKGRTQDAISSLQRAVDYAPTTARARFLLASAFALSGETERSSREIRAAFDIDSSAARASDYLLLVEALRRAGNATAAAEAIETAVKRYPLDPALRAESADVLQARKQPVAALGELLYARMLVPIGDAQTAALTDKIAQLRAEAEAATPDPDPQLEALFSYLDDAATGQYDEALPTIQDVVSADPTAFVPRLLLARAYVETGRLAEAERVLDQLVAEDPSSAPALAELANIYFAESRPEAGRRAASRARSLAPATPRLKEIAELWKEQ
jgi:tetratricopeptide (TPR) repeat protein